MDSLSRRQGAYGAVADAAMRYRLVIGGLGGGSPIVGEQNRTASLSHKDDAGSEAAIRADHALMQAIADGDEDVFARVIATEGPRLTRFVAALLSDVAEAEEIVQETLLRLWKNAATWEPKARMRTWLHRVAYRLAIDRLRRRRPHVDIDDLDDQIEDEAPGPERQLDRADDVRLVHEALERLSDRHRAVIVLAHFQEVGQAEAANIMGMGEHAYESLLARARRRLRTLLEAQDETGGEWTRS